MDRYDKIVEVEKFNPYHDARGRFSSSPGGAAGSVLSPQEFEEDCENAKLWRHERSKDYFEEAIKLYSKYQEGTADKTSFFHNTIAIYQETRRPRRPPDHVSYDRNGKVSSEYWYTENAVIRGSNHWGTGVASCDWALARKDGTSVWGKRGNDVSQTAKLYGKSEWSDFLLKPQIANIEGVGEVVQSFNNMDGKRHMNVNGKLYFGYRGKWTEVGESISYNPFIDNITDF